MLSHHSPHANIVRCGKKLARQRKRRGRKCVRKNLKKELPSLFFHASANPEKVYRVKGTLLPAPFFLYPTRQASCLTSLTDVCQIYLTFSKNVFASANYRTNMPENQLFLTHRFFCSFTASGKCSYKGRGAELTTAVRVRAAVGLNLHLLQDRYRLTCHLAL